MYTLNVHDDFWMRKFGDDIKNISLLSSSVFYWIINDHLLSGVQITMVKINFRLFQGAHVNSGVKAMIR